MGTPWEARRTVRRPFPLAVPSRSCARSQGDDWTRLTGRRYAPAAQELERHLEKLRRAPADNRDMATAGHDPEFCAWNCPVHLDGNVHGKELVAVAVHDERARPDRAQ